MLLKIKAVWGSETWEKELTSEAGTVQKCEAQQPPLVHGEKVGTWCTKGAKGFNAIKCNGIKWLGCKGVEEMHWWLDCK